MAAASINPRTEARTGVARGHGTLEVVSGCILVRSAAQLSRVDAQGDPQT